jgi:hypothetical protein
MVKVHPPDTRDRDGAALAMESRGQQRTGTNAEGARSGPDGAPSTSRAVA